MESIKEIFNRPEVGSVSLAIDIFKETRYKPYPPRPIKPRKSDFRDNSKDMQEYARLLAIYESENLKYNDETAVINAHNSKISGEIEEFIKEQAELYKLTESQQSKVWWKAWQDGHSNGYYEVYLQLLDLVDLFE